MTIDSGGRASGVATLFAALGLHESALAEHAQDLGGIGRGDAFGMAHFGDGEASALARIADADQAARSRILRWRRASSGEPRDGDEVVDAQRQFGGLRHSILGPGRIERQC